MLPIIPLLGAVMKKFAVALVLSFLASSALAYDFGPAAIVAGIGATAVVLVSVFGAGPALATLAIGSIVSGVTFDTNQSGTNPIAVQLSPGSKFPTPEGWTPPASGETQPTPPASATPSLGYQIAIGAGSQAQADTCSGGQMQYVTSDPAAACQVQSCYIAQNGWTGAAASGTDYGTSYNCKTVYNGSTVLNDVTWSPSTTCPAGYTGSGGNCTLSDASQVTKPADLECGVQRVGNVIMFDPRDPDCSNVAPGVTVSSNSVTVNNPDGSSRSITINSDGTATVQESRPNAATNTTETNSTNLSAPNASGAVQVTGQASGATQGIGTANTDTPASGFDTSGLASEGTLAGIKGDTEAIKNALSGDGLDSTLTAQKSAFDAAVDGLIGMFSGEASKNSGLDNDFSFGGYLPAQCGCEPLTMTILGKTRSYDWCTPMETFKSALAWVLGIFTAVYVLSLFRVGGN